MMNKLERRFLILENKTSPDMVWTRVTIPKGASATEEERLTSEAIECAQIQNVGREVGVIQRIII